MRTITILSAVAMASLVGAGELAIDMQIDFPLYPRATAAVALPPTFTQTLGGASAPPVTSSTDPKKPFTVNGETFTDLKTAVSKSCSQQHQNCSTAANSPGGGGGGGGKSAAAGVTVNECDQQQTDCIAAGTSTSTSSSVVGSSDVTATATGAQILRSEDANFFYFCDS